MKEIVSSPHLCVMQVEIDIYTFLKKVSETVSYMQCREFVRPKLKKNNVCLQFPPNPAI